jgi:transcriptional regulator with XRE-family HTH domain
LSQGEVAFLLGIKQQTYSKREKPRARAFSPDDLAKIVQRLGIDARWIFGQIDGPVEAADLKVAGAGEIVELREVLAEHHAWKESLSKDDRLAQRIHSDPELEECIEVLIANRGLISRVMGYLDGRLEERKAGAESTAIEAPTKEREASNQ